MFEQAAAVLDNTIEELDIPVDAAALVRCLELSDRLTAKVTVAVGEFDAVGAWRDVGATSMTAWLRSQAHRSSREAATLARTGRRLRDLPVTTRAYADGTLSSGQVQAIVANLNDKIVSLFADAERELVPVLAAMPVADVSTAMQQWAQAAKDSLDDPGNGGDPEGPERRLHVSATLDGRREISGSLDPEAGALLHTALRLALTRDSDAEPPRTPARRRADALVDILRHFLDHQHDHAGGGRHRPHLNVFLDYQDLAGDHTPGQECPGGRRPQSGWLPDGTVLDTATIQRLVCDCAIHRVVHQGRSSILDYGMSTRTAPANLYAALVARDRHCRFPGCDRPAEWCEGHHVPSYLDGGPTSLTTMVLDCSRHHHLVHQPGWTDKLLPDGTYIVTNPRGQTFTTYPPGRPPDLFEPPPP